MFRSLIVPLDGSELAERALPYAVQLARAANGRLTLLRVALAPPPARLDGADWEIDQARAVEEAQTYLDSVRDKVATRVPVNTRVTYGRAPQGILDAITTDGLDAVVMATHGRTGIAHLVYGSVAEAVLAASPVPVVLVHARPGEAVATPFDPTQARAAVPLDGSPYAALAIETAINLVGPAGEIVLTCIVEPPEEVQRTESGKVIAYLDQQEEALSRGAREYLEEIAADLRRAHPGLRVTQSIGMGEPGPAIATTAVEACADVIVMSTHGRTGLARARVGSVAGQVLAEGVLPVVLVGPHEAHRAGQEVAAQAIGQ